MVQSTKKIKNLQIKNVTLFVAPVLNEKARDYKSGKAASNCPPKFEVKSLLFINVC